MTSSGGGSGGLCSWSTMTWFYQKEERPGAYRGLSGDECHTNVELGYPHCRILVGIPLWQLPGRSEPMPGPHVRIVRVSW